MSSYTLTESTTFTLTHAKHIAAKVATDLKRLQRFYGYPSDEMILKYESEATEFLKHGYLETVTYGFQKNGNWIEPTLKYVAKDLLSGTSEDDDPGRIRANADISGASFYSYLTYTRAWWNLSDEERTKFRGQLPFQRSTAEEPGINGYLSSDRTYSAGGKALDRSTVRSY